MHSEGFFFGPRHHLIAEKLLLPRVGTLERRQVSSGPACRL